MDRSKKNGIYMLTGKTTNKIGNVIFDYINNVLIASLGTKASNLLALYQSSEIIVNILFNMLGGVFADLKNRKKIIIITDLTASLATFLLYLFWDSKNSLFLIILINILLALLYSFNSPAYKAIVKDILKAEDLNKFNSYSNAFSEVVSVLGPLVAISTVHYFGFKTGMLINSISFLISAYCVSRFQVINYVQKKKKGKEKYMVVLSDGFKYVLKQRNVLELLIVSSFINFFLAGYNFFLPYTNIFSENQGIYASILITESIGSIVGALLNRFFFKKIDLKSIHYCLFFMGISLLFLALFRPFKWSMFFYFFIFSISLTIYNIKFFTYIQNTVDTEFLGRVFSIVFTVAVLFMPIGSFFFANFTTPSWNAFGFIGTGILFLFLILLIKMKMFKNKEEK
ncbi:MFS transporter (plasmid) [Bacillus paranthracis]|uniref:MFS transporter n=1 Tax=Bacillus TaxID=1386 RepID=UPI000ABA5F89|nr:MULTISPECIES: MFS transporter [Bacillus cereus group]MCC2341966.1 MFS transporter [Bacillus tropicus]MCC2441888.1 MFS transporter [Bacillus paranthracis]WCA21651.1 MFS transporter [Bacillus paranthracis]